MNIRELQIASHQLAIEKGWYDTERTIPELIALCHSELSEALEEYRITASNELLHVIHWRTDGKPESFAIELADAIIRICDMAAYAQMDLQSAIETKMAYNRIRGYRHGNKRV